MSSLRGGGRGRGRGTFTLGQNNALRQQPRAGFQTRGRADSTAARGTFRGRGNASTRGQSAQRGNARGGRGDGIQRSRTPTPMSQESSGTDYQSRFQSVSDAPRGPRTQQSAPHTYEKRFEQLKRRREDERKDAIKRGFLADPEKPRKLAEAITPVGTCPDMCAEYERLERIVQKDVWAQETKEDGTPSEGRMVKKFRRAAAGLDEQLPSDLRPPSTLKKTCDYLFDELVGNAESLGSVHHFVWDRTRAIRNDFSIQQITKPSDVEIAIECYERIARFHILSLHQLAVPEKPYDKYDWYQEREQLDRTLLSLMQYYDDNRTRVDCKNEPEFRAYCIVFQIQDPTPDLEERVNCWDEKIKTHPRVRTALDLYNAACNTLDSQGPLKPRAAHVVARADWNDFFTIAESNRVSYTMACVAEIYFNMVRKLTLNSIWRACGVSKEVSDFTMEYLTELLRFDDPEETRTFCEHYTFGFKETDSGEEYLDLNSVQGKIFPDATQGLNAQIFSEGVVESKRAGRTFPAVIRGLSFAAAQAQGMIVEEERDDEEMAMDGEDSLFVPQTQMNAAAPAFAPKASPFAAPTTSPFGQPAKTDDAAKPASSPFSFGAPSSQSDKPQNQSGQSGAEAKSSPFASPSSLKDSIFAQKPATSWGKPSTSPWGAPPASSNAGQPTTSPFAQPPAQSPFVSNTSTTFGKPKEGGLDSVHSPSSFSWGKPSSAPSPWSQPLPAGNTDAVQKDEQPAPKPATTSNFDSPLSKPANEAPAKPLFSFGAPAAPATNTEAPKPASPFANFSTSASQPATSNTEKAANPFANISSSTAAATPTENEEPRTHSAAPSIFSKPQQQEEQAVQTPKPSSSFSPTPPASTPSQQQESQTPKLTFAFPTTTSATQEPKASPIQKPLFNFASTTPPGSPPATEKPEQSIQITAEKSTAQTSAPIFGAPQPPATAPSKAQPGKVPSFNFSSPNQPRKPSPLSQSFTAPSETQEQTANIAQTATKPSFSAFGKPAEQPPKVTEAPKPTASPTQILQKLAEEMTLDVDKGLLRQFVEYHARSAIMSVFDELYLDSIREIADKFRAEKLAIRYGKRWRQTAWKLRLNRQARDKRERKRTAHRQREALDARKKHQEKVNAVDDFLKSQALRSSQASVNGTSRLMERTGHDNGVLRSSTSSAGDRDAASREMPPPTSRPSADAPKRRSLNRVDDAGKVTKPTVSPTATPNVNRSSFLGFSMQWARIDSSASKPPSRSSYFRMKAMGINPNGPSMPTPKVKKRAREDDGDIVDSTPVAKKSKTPPRTDAGSSRMRSASFRSQSSVQSSILELSPGPEHVTRPVRSTSKSQDEDEALFARARAARKALAESGNWYRSEVEKADDAESVVSGRSQVSTSASLQRVREEARLRASQRSEASRFGMSGMSGVSGLSQYHPDVPAYRLRESRFVPREQYGRAVEIAKERAAIRSSPQSVVHERSGATTPRAQQSPPRLPLSFQSFPQPDSQSQSQSRALEEHAQRLSEQSPPPLQLFESLQPIDEPQLSSLPEIRSFEEQAQRSPSQLPLTFQDVSRPESLPAEEAPVVAATDFGLSHHSPSPAPVVVSNVDAEQADQDRPFLDQIPGVDSPSIAESFQPTADQGLNIATEDLHDVSAPTPSLWSFSNLNSPSTLGPAQGESVIYKPAFSPSVGFGFMPAFGESAFKSAGAEESNERQQHESHDTNGSRDEISQQMTDHQENNSYEQESVQYPELSATLSTSNENSNSYFNGAASDSAQMLNDAAREALAMDSSYVNDEMMNQDTNHTQNQEQTPVNGQHSACNATPQIDPDLLDLQTNPPIAEQLAVHEQESEAKPAAKKKDSKPVASMNPFALLANGTDDTSESVSSSSEGSDSDMDDDADEDGTTVPNGLIQDRLGDRHNLSELEDDDLVDEEDEDEDTTQRAGPSGVFSQTLTTHLAGPELAQPDADGSVDGTMSAVSDEEIDDDGDGEIYDEEGEEYDSENEDGVDDDEDDDEEESEDEDDDGQDYSAYAPRTGGNHGGGAGMSAQQLQESGVIKGGTGQSAEDAFELSD
ncbi:hypothetical protein MBLNU457_g0823t1 [Dothideomycetes sp. NU457]